MGSLAPVEFERVRTDDQQSKANWETSILFQEVGGSCFKKANFGASAASQRNLAGGRQTKCVAETLIQYRSLLAAAAA